MPTKMNNFKFEWFIVFRSSEAIKISLIQQFEADFLFLIFVWFDSLRPLNNLSVMRDGSSWVEPVLS